MVAAAAAAAATAATAELDFRWQPWGCSGPDPATPATRGGCHAQDSAAGGSGREPGPRPEAPSRSPVREEAGDQVPSGRDGGGQEGGQGGLGALQVPRLGPVLVVGRWVGGYVRA